MIDLNRLLLHRHLDEDEEVQRIVHKHWLYGCSALFWPSVAFVAGWAFYYVAPFPSILLIVALWSVGSLVWLLRNFFDYYLDAWIITDQGIIDVEWFGWFHRESTRVLFSDIQGVSYEVQGVMSTLFRMGTVSVEKISTGSSFELEHVPRPRQVELAILRSMENYLHSKNMKNAKHVQEILAAFVADQMHARDMEGEGDDDTDES